MIARPAGVEWGNTGEAALLQVEAVGEGVDRAHGVILGHAIVERRWKNAARVAIQPFHEPGHPSPCRFSERIIAFQGFFTQPRPEAVHIEQRRSVVWCSSGHTEHAARKSKMLRRRLLGANAGGQP